MGLAPAVVTGIRPLPAPFLHTPASVPRYAAVLCSLPWSVSAHAKDIWTIPAWEKRGKLAAAQWAVTCTEVGRAHLAELAPSADTVALCYHGLDAERFPSPPPGRGGAEADGGDPMRPVTLLSVGRVVAKKGYDDLLSALALLPPGLVRFFGIIAGGA